MKKESLSLLHDIDFTLLIIKLYGDYAHLIFVLVRPFSFEFSFPLFDDPFLLFYEWKNHFSLWNLGYAFL